MKAKKFLALFLAGLLCVCALAGCGKKDFDSVVTIDGTPVTPGIYRLFQTMAYMEAAQSVPDTSTDLFAQKIEDVAVLDWINNRTVDLLKSFVYFEKEFDAQKLSFTDKETKDIDDTIAADWAEVSAIYEKNGVVNADFTIYERNSFKVQKLFETANSDVTDAEIKTYLDTNFALVNYVQLPLVSADGSAMSEENSAKIAKNAENALKKIKSGEDFTAVATAVVPECYALGGFGLNGADPAKMVQTAFLNITAKDASKELAEKVASTALNEAGLHKMDGQYYLLFRRIPNFDTEADFQSLRSSLLYQMRHEDYAKKTSAVYDAYEVVSDSAAVKYYTPKNLDLTNPAASSAPVSSAAASSTAVSSAASK